MSGTADLDRLKFRLPASVKTPDLDPTKCMRLAIARAFPLPDSGNFKDLLAAIDEGSQATPRSDRS